MSSAGCKAEVRTLPTLVALAPDAMPCLRPSEVRTIDTKMIECVALGRLFISVRSRFRLSETLLRGMNQLLAHRGPDGEGAWVHERHHVGLAHRRLSIIGIDDGNQPMTDLAGNWIAYNGEIYNYLELRNELGRESFSTSSDTEVILGAYRRWGIECLTHLRGMFAFALWDERDQTLLVTRDRFGIKPMYYTVIDDVLYCASEIKALLPFLSSIETDEEGLRDYLTFQFTLANKTLFRGVRELAPGHFLRVRNGSLSTHRYWEVEYEPDVDHTEPYLVGRLTELLRESVGLHLRADVPVGAYLSGGLDSSIVTTLAAGESGEPFMAFSGKFAEGPRYDESAFARAVASESSVELHEVEIGPDDFAETIASVIYHLDQPVAGPGAFPNSSCHAWLRVTARSSLAGRVVTKSSEDMRATCSPISNNASRAQSRGRRPALRMS